MIWWVALFSNPLFYPLSIVEVSSDACRFYPSFWALPCIALSQMSKAHEKVIQRSKLTPIIC